LINTRLQHFKDRDSITAASSGLGLSPWPKDQATFPEVPNSKLNFDISISQVWVKREEEVRLKDEIIWEKPKQPLSDLKFT